MRVAHYEPGAGHSSEKLISIFSYPSRRGLRVETLYGPSPWIYVVEVPPIALAAKSIG